MKEKREKFVKLANKRVASALDKMRLISNLADKRYYDYTNEDTKKIIDALTKELNSIKIKFHNNIKNKEKEFKLDL